MKGLLFFTIDVENTDTYGLAKKMFSQNNAFKKLGVETDLIHFKKGDILLNDEVIFKKRNTKSPIKYIYDRHIRVYSTIIDRCELGDYDFLYIRYPLANPWLIKFLHKVKKLNKNIIILLEVASYPYDLEKRSFNQRVFLMVDKLWRRLLKRDVDQVVTYADFDKIFGIPTLSTDNNGVDLDKIKLKKTQQHPKKLTLIGVAGLSIWHGYERIIKGVAEYYKQRQEENQVDLSFLIVGDGPEFQNLSNLIDELNINNHVRLVGQKRGKELDDLFDQCQVAAASFGLHRLNIQSGSTIKVREYCARGIPFILSYDDIGLGNDFKYALKFPANDDPIDINQVIEFYDNKSGESVSREIRAYAAQNFTWEVTIKPVYDKICELKSI
ncbi:glycosyltransferase [Fulvivirgaceae bacterium BMA12]|uniref:Glycosyltransferase n=1 Tax=Agaribacillus aureus TaxID=3051825 RepID=A0ABT8LDW2_9BACT|nr:glycosyltransferase [Fulvivirgaceae bacterium BMA12]